MKTLKFCLTSLPLLLTTFSFAAPPRPTHVPPPAHSRPRPPVHRPGRPVPPPPVATPAPPPSHHAPGSPVVILPPPRRGRPDFSGVPPVYPRPPAHYRPHVPGRLFTPPPVRPDDFEDEAAASLMSHFIEAKGCDRAGEMLRELSNMLVSSARFELHPENRRPISWGDSRDRARFESHTRWVGHFRSTTFWKKVWDRLALAYRSCNRTCFDDGYAVGQISATGYCSASIAVGGLDAPGGLLQPPLPLCQNETFVGCQKGYDDTSEDYDGCQNYTSGGYTDIYLQSKSQDCHIEQ